MENSRLALYKEGDLCLKIYKYELFDRHGELEIEMYKGAKILSVDEQDNKPVLWALVNTLSPLEKKRFFISRTGKEITKEIHPPYYKFLGTIKLDKGAYIFHVFDISS